MLTRVERNKKHKRTKRRFRLFILIIIILASISIIHINKSYNELLDTHKTNQIFAIDKDNNTMGITVLGQQIEISEDYILLGKEFLQNIQKKALKQINNIIKNINLK